MTLNEFNNLSEDELDKLLSNCCGSMKWKREMMKEFPFKDEVKLMDTAQKIWYNNCNEADWLDAFTHHPKIGNIDSIAEKFPTTKQLAGDEQADVKDASPETLRDLIIANREYEARYGFIFIVSATGKSATVLLRLLKDRLKNNLKEELHIAMGEQYKITFLRLHKILSEAKWEPGISQLTTHILDTSKGTPCNDITIRLKHFYNEVLETIAQGITNIDGRINDLLPPGVIMEKGNYKMVFETGNYFNTQNLKSFYPEVEISFTVLDDTHYHVPLLINPFGYTTYRGS